MQIQPAALRQPPRPRPNPPAGTPPEKTDMVSLSHTVEAKLAPVLTNRLRPGDKVSIDLIPEGRKVVVEGEGGPHTESWFSNLAAFATAAVQEVGTAVQAGPNLALAGAAEAIKPLVLDGVPDDATAYVNQAYQPVMQGVSALISFKEFVDKWRQNHTKLEREGILNTWDKVGFVAHGLHTLTSTAGVAGAAVGALVPSLRHLGMWGMGVALAGHVGMFAVNELEYVEKRGELVILPVPNNKNAIH